MTLVLFMGLRPEARGYVLAMVVLLPVSTAILILSMFISSAAGGGIDFGDARIVIPKAAALLFVINTINLSPCGPMGAALTFPIWLFGLMSLFKLDLWETRMLFLVNWILNFVARWVIGLMSLFKLDLWETRMLFLVNWILNFVARWVVIGIFISGAMQMSEEPEDVSPSDGGAEIVALGGECVYGPGPGRPVVAIRLKGPQGTDETVAKVANSHFPHLRSLDLSYSRVTDAGLEELADMDQLEELNLKFTRVTDVAVAKLQQALPGLKILR
jgi:hypothetical protein